jgi:WD40 repeat protein
MKPITRHRFQLYALDVHSSDGELVYGGGKPTQSCDLYIQPLNGDSKPCRVPGHTKTLIFAKYLPNDTILAVGFDKQATIWTREGDRIAGCQPMTQSRCDAFCIDSNGKRLIAGTGRGMVQSISLDHWKMEGEFQANEKGYQVWDLAAHPTRSEVLVGSSTGDFGCWDLDRIQPRWENALAWGHHVNGVAYSADGKRCAAVSAPDGAAEEGAKSSVILLDSDTGETMATYSLGGPQPTCCAFNDNGSLLAVGCGGTDRGGRAEKPNSIIFVFDLNTGEIKHRFEGHADRVHNVRFRPTHNQMLSVGMDGTLRLWDMQEEAEPSDATERRNRAF